jgi:hypothetical protein
MSSTQNNSLPPTLPNGNTETKSLRIDIKLDRNNYAFWLFMITPVLQEHALIDMNQTTFNEDGSFKVIKVKAINRTILAIQTNVTQDIGLMLMNLKTATTMWDFLYNEFSGKNDSRKFAGIKKIALFNYEKPTLKENLQTLQGIIQQTTVAAGSDTFRFDDLGVAMFLNSLLDTFHSTRSILEQSSKSLTMENMASALLAEEERMNLRERSDGFVGMSKRTPITSKCSHDRAKHRCWICPIVI